MPEFSLWVIILAAGSSQRFSTASQNLLSEQNLPKKQFLLWQNLPLYWHSAITFAKVPLIQGLIFVLPSDELEAETERCQKLASQYLKLPYFIVAGGKERQNSVFNGLSALPESASHILIHDAARPFVSSNLIENICLTLQNGAKAVIPGLQPTDTIKQIKQTELDTQKQYVELTLKREQLIAAQTPQGFELLAYKKAWQKLQSANITHNTPLLVTDDAAIMEFANFEVEIIAGEANNRKITYREDLKYLDMTQKTNPKMRVGFGYDVHKFGTGRPLRLGGLEINSDLEIVAHSDGDILLHAICDALLGCACLGDLGEHFPDSDPQFENISSSILLENCRCLLLEHNLQIEFVDLTLVCQKPRLLPYKSAIKKNIARLLELDSDCVNLKATTEEGLGFTGRVEGIKAYAVVTALKF